MKCIYLEMAIRKGLLNSGGASLSKNLDLHVVDYLKAQINPEGFIKVGKNWTVDSFKSCWWLLSRRMSYICFYKAMKVIVTEVPSKIPLWVLDICMLLK